MRQYLTTLILIITLPLGELYNYCSDTKVQNWILKAYRPMPESWNVKFAMSEVVIILYFVAWLLYKPNSINRTTVIAFVMLSVMDIFMYFYNYKLGGFGSVYFWFICFWLLEYKWHSLKIWK